MDIVNRHAVMWNNTNTDDWAEPTHPDMNPFMFPTDIEDGVVQEKLDLGEGFRIV